MIYASVSATSVVAALGALGLFLLGMTVMTNGLKTLADDKLRKLLARSTRSPISGAVTGAVSTAVIQSSSATTVTAVGFVGAGLLTFPQALGVIFGANIGTTMTGWFVALLGFKLNLGQAVLPLILVGVLLRLFGRPRWKAAGTALAGFGLIFVGISQFQRAFEMLPEISLPESGILGRLLLVLIGAAITVVTQSSSAGVAAAMAAVHAGTIDLSQAASMVIGMDVGTTSTALIATIGGNVQARRTGLAHVIYNVLTAVAAFALLDAFLLGLDRFGRDIAATDPEVALAAFHTLFNILGVSVVLPFTDQFARLIIRLAPDRGNRFSNRLEPSLLTTPTLAIEAVRATLRDVTQDVFQRLVTLLQDSEAVEKPDEYLEMQQALTETHDYIQLIRITPDSGTIYQVHVASIHILDHLNRLVRRALTTSRVATVRQDEDLTQAASKFADAIRQAIDSQGTDPEIAGTIHQAYRELKAGVKPYRRQVIQRAAAGALDPKSAIARADAIRWLRRVAYHVRRIALHMAEESQVMQK